MTRTDFYNCKDFIPKVFDLEEYGVKVLGYFPYETASLSEGVRVPRKVHHEFEWELRKNRINDNKIVVICQDLTRFGTESFAIQFKDCVARVAKWHQVVGYDQLELKQR